MDKKKKLAPPQHLITSCKSLFLAILLITSCDMVEEVGSKLVCDIYWPLCIEKCYKSGNCMRCCKYWGFVHGRCNLFRVMGCYCCADDSDPVMPPSAIATSTTSSRRWSHRRLNPDHHLPA